MAPRLTPLLVRFNAKVEPEGECLVWRGVKAGPYGMLWVNEFQRKVQAHRVAWYLEHDAWPTGEIDHLCHNKTCVRIEHLRDVSHRTNLHNSATPSIVANQTNTCFKGHVGQWYVRKDGTKRCAVCHRQKMRERYARSKAVVLRTDA